MGQTHAGLGAGARIAVVGGGPAGSHFALSLIDLANRHARPVPEIVIFEQKRFSDAGPRGCNSCAGIIQSCMLAKVARLGISLGDGIIQGHVRDYVLHTRRGRHIRVLSQPSPWPIVATYRGGGPAFATPKGALSYDEHMLGIAEERGVRIVRGAVVGMTLPRRPSDPVLVESHREEGTVAEAFDLVVWASGLHPRSLDVLEGLGFGYVRPRTVRAFQAELPVSAAWLEGLEGDVNVFGPILPGMAFGALVPKRDHLTVSLVGYRDLDRRDLAAFLALPVVRGVLPPGWEPPRRICQCHPRVAVTSARQPCTDRIVVIGDANCGRLYKGGIDSAYLTAAFAAEAALLHGVDRASLERHFLARCRHRIHWDNRFGEILFALSKWGGRWPMLEEAHLDVARRGGTAARLQQDILWGLFTGEASYASLVARALHPALVWAYLRALLEGLPGVKAR